MKKAKNNYKLLDCWDAREIPPETTFEDRRSELEKMSIVSEIPFKDPLCVLQTPMPIYEEVIVMACWLLFFAIPLWGPFVILWLLYAHLTFGIFCLVICFMVSNVPMLHNTRVCYHYLASLTLKYFSFRAIWTTTIPKGTYIGVTPPHGLFPIAGICGIFALPR